MTDLDVYGAGGIQPPHRRFILIETLIGAVMSGLVPAVLIGLLGPKGATPIHGFDGVLFPLIGATVPPAFGMPIILTLVVRHRVRTGGAPALASPHALTSLVRFMPRNLLLRGLVSTLVASVVLPVSEAGLLSSLGVVELSRSGFIALNFIHGLLLGLLLLPVVLTAALMDRPRTSAPANA